MPEEIDCPECGKPAARWEDPTGAGYQCTNLQCLNLIEDGDDHS
jgi:hypothetical protein